MAISNKLTLVALLVCSLSSVYTEMIMCNEKCPDLCKLEFGKKFDEEYRKLHTNMVKKVFQTNIDAMNELSGKLPEDDIDARVLKDTVVARTEDMKKIDENMENPNELAKIMHRSFSSPTMPLLDPKNDDDHPEEYFKINEKYHPYQVFSEEMMNLMKNTAKLYTEMYGELRDLDKSRYREYQTINNAMKFVQDENEEEILMRTFYEAMVMMAKYFDTPFVDHIEELFDDDNNNAD